MASRIINGRWFSNIYDPDNPKIKIVVSLDAYAPEKRKAQINLGRILQDMENGIRPTSARSKISKLKIVGLLPTRGAQILRTHIYPFFGDYKPREVNRELLESYIEHRFGRDRQGNLQAYGNTIKKELLALQQLLCAAFGPSYRLPKISYKKLKRELLQPLTIHEIDHASKFVDPQYKEIFWIMALTGMDISDVVTLCRADFKDGWIIKLRGKTDQKIEVPICSELRDIMKPLPLPLDKSEQIFKVGSKAVSLHIRRAFAKGGLPGYGSKYLRRFIGTILLAHGNTKDWIARILSHAEGSAQTDAYLGVYKTQAEDEFNKITIGGIR